MSSETRDSMHAESGLAYDSNGLRYDVTQWRKDLATLLTTGSLEATQLLVLAAIINNPTAALSLETTQQSVLAAITANQPRELVNSNGNSLGVDLATRVRIGIDYAHHEIHDENAYFCQYSVLADNTDTQEVRIESPATTNWAHMIIEVTGSLAGTAELWRATTKTHVIANALPCVNRDFNSTNVSGMTLCHTPAGAQAGAAHLSAYYGATASGGRVAEGGGAANRHEFILKSGEAILIRNTSRANGNALNIILDWYMHTNKTD